MQKNLSGTCSKTKLADLSSGFMLKVRKATVEDLSILLKFHVKLLKFSQKFDSFLLADKKTILREKKELRKALKDNKKTIFLS